MNPTELAKAITSMRVELTALFQRISCKEERAKRGDYVAVPHERRRFLGERTLEWVLHEQQSMHELVNTKREELGKDPLDLSEVLRVEQMAVGHVDYGTKFPLYCAELVFKEELGPIQP